MEPTNEGTRYRRLTPFFKLLKGDAPEYMTARIPQPKHLNCSLRVQNVFEPSATRTQGYYGSYYPYCLREWNKLHPSLRSIDSISKFKAELEKSLRPPERSVFKISDIVGFRLLTRFWLGFGHMGPQVNRKSVNQLCDICLAFFW